MILSTRAYGFFPHHIRTVSLSNLKVSPALNARIGGNPAILNDLRMPCIWAGGCDESFTTTTIPTSPRFNISHLPFLSYIYRAGNPAFTKGVKISCAHKLASVSIQSYPTSTDPLGSALSDRNSASFLSGGTVLGCTFSHSSRLSIRSSSVVFSASAERSLAWAICNDNPSASLRAISADFNASAARAFSSDACCSALAARSFSWLASSSVLAARSKALAARSFAAPLSLCASASRVSLKVWSRPLAWWSYISRTPSAATPSTTRSQPISPTFLTHLPAKQEYVFGQRSWNISGPSIKQPIATIIADAATQKKNLSSRFWRSSRILPSSSRINSGEPDALIDEETRRTDWIITFSYLLLWIGIAYAVFIGFCVVMFIIGRYRSRREAKYRQNNA